jgi:hypothetical protein
MKTLIILMFVMLIVLLAFNVTLYLNFNKRLNNLRSLCSGGFNQFSENTTDVYSHINSIYQTIKDLKNTISNFKTVLDTIELKYDNIVNNITTYVHKDNDAHKKELINCMANSFTDMITYISNTVRNANKERNLNINDELLYDIKECVFSIQQVLGDTNLDVKTISDKELAKISSTLKDTQNQLDCISKQIEACNKLKTATKSKSTKSDKPAAKKKTPLL